MNESCKQTIYFYDNETDLVKKEHIFLNNFDPSPFLDDQNLSFFSVEHYYQVYDFTNIQAHKFDDFSKEHFQSAFEEIRSIIFYIRTAETPLICKKAARKYEDQFKEIWDKEAWQCGRKETIMKKGLIFKFTQNPDLLERLLLTGDSLLIEASNKDPYWGGMLPDSKNRLGLLLMELRDNYNKCKSLFF